MEKLKSVENYNLWNFLNSYGLYCKKNKIKKVLSAILSLLESLLIVIFRNIQELRRRIVLFRLRPNIFFPLVDTLVRGTSSSYKEPFQNCTGADEAENAMFYHEILKKL